MEATHFPEPPAVPCPVPAYPTLRESWAFVGWYLLAALVVGGACYALLTYATHLPRIENVMAATVAGNVGLLLLLRWKAGARWQPWQPWQLAGQARAWHLAPLPLVVVAAQLVLSPLEFLHLTNSMGKRFEDLSHHIGVALLMGGVAVPILEELLFRGWC
ncbi:MAG: hypothetical protein M3Y12_04950 [Bacteroidota bacterium]|nr:hypothetical protein [Bacteroidota bacterium]